VDLAIAHLSRPLSSVMQPLSPGGSIGSGEALTIYGFGLGVEGNTATARALRRATLVSAGTYTSANSVIVAADQRTMGASPGAGACRGDSGGPIMRGGSAELVGLVSWSSSPATGRSRRVCGGFTAVTPLAEHSAWIAAASQALAEMPQEARQSYTGGQRRGRSVTRRSASP
jgi:secreted trypsin-like serine protease